MATDEHGTCKSCGFNLNGERVYDYFFEEYRDHEKALETASHYGATQYSGRFGKAIYIKPYDENYRKLPSYHICPECREKCY